jgi:hypothetical protein
VVFKAMTGNRLRIFYRLANAKASGCATGLLPKEATLYSSDFANLIAVCVTAENWFLVLAN